MPDHLCSRQDLVQGLTQAGVRPGMCLVVHSAMKKLGWIPGGAQTLLDVLIELLGPQGTLVMPSQTGENSDPSYWRHPPVPKAWWPTVRTDMPPFDPYRTPPRKMGALANCFYRYPGVQRSNHPTTSFAARGPKASIITARHELSGSLGEQSPCGELYRQDAHVLLIGVDFDNCTVMHLAEYKSRCRPHFKQSSSILADGRAAWASYIEMDVNSDEFIQPGRQLEKAGLVQKTKIHQATLRLFKVRDGVDQAAVWFQNNRLQQLTEADQPALMAYLEEEPAYNLFIIGDIENFGMETDFQDVMVYKQNGQFDSVLLRYHQSYIVYSDKTDFSVEPVLSALDTPNLKVLSGKKDVIDVLKPKLSQFDFRETFLLRLQHGELKDAIDDQPIPPGVKLRQAVPEDAKAIQDLLETIHEFDDTRINSYDERIEQIQTALKQQASHYYFFEHQGQVIACAGTAAENSRSAMVVAVATAKAWRGQGLASRLLYEMAEDLLTDRLSELCLFYDNEEAGRIYRRLGYKDIGTWVMATRKKDPDKMMETRNDAD